MKDSSLAETKYRLVSLTLERLPREANRSRHLLATTVMDVSFIVELVGRAAAVLYSRDRDPEYVAPAVCVVEADDDAFARFPDAYNDQIQNTNDRNAFWAPKTTQYKCHAHGVRSISEKQKPSLEDFSWD
jgi:hypothetical protein